MIIVTTRPTLEASAKPAGKPSWASHSARRRPSVAPENAPDRTPTRVIPIWTVEETGPDHLRVRVRGVRQ